MVQRISTNGSLFFAQNLIGRSGQKFQELQYQVSTGRKYSTLKEYGTSASRILDLSNEVESREAYKKSIDLTELTGRAYDASLERMVEIMDDLVASTTPVSPIDPDWSRDNAVIADNLLLDFQVNLNLDIGGKFIYSGANFNSIPVNDLRSLLTYTPNDIGVPNVIETGDQIPEHVVDSGGANTVESYLTFHNGSPTLDPKANQVGSVTIADGQRIDYGINATDPAFQTAVEALIRFKSATQPGITTAERSAFLQEAAVLADNARNDIRHLQSENGIVLNELNNTKQLHTNFINISNNALTDITVADTAEAATKISTLQTIIQASYTTISRKAQLSLVNYL